MTESKHVINLRGPWQWAGLSLSGHNSALEFRRFIFPAQLAALAVHTDSSQILLARDFGRPSGLTGQHRVELVIDPIACCQAILLNDEPLEFGGAEAGLARCDITSRVRWRNRLRITYQLPQRTTTESRPLHDVRVEIFEPH